MVKERWTSEQYREYLKSGQEPSSREPTPEEVVDTERRKFEEGKERKKSQAKREVERAKEEYKKEHEYDKPTSGELSYKEKIKRKGREVYGGIKSTVRSYAERPFETYDERERRLEQERYGKIVKATSGMLPEEKAEYVATYKERGERKAREKARYDEPIGETYEERKARLQKKREKKEEVAFAYQKSRASAAGKIAGESAPPNVFGLTRPDIEKQRSPTSAGTIYNPMFSSQLQIGSQPATLFNPMFSQPQYQPAPPEPQPERRMSRREMHRQQVRENTQRMVREQQQQFLQTNVYYPFAPQSIPLPSHNGIRNQPRFKNLFEGHQPANNMSNDSNKQSMPKMVNLFERTDIPTNTKIGKHKPHPLAEFSASLLNIDTVGTPKNGSKNGKKKYVKALWEL